VHRALSLDDKQPSESRAYIGLRSNRSTYNPKPLGPASAGAGIDVRSICLQGCSYRCLCYVVAALVTKTPQTHLSTDASGGGGGDEVTERPVNATLRDSSDPSLNPRVPLATLPVMFM
jgi:hypothetical protein